MKTHKVVNCDEQTCAHANFIYNKMYAKILQYRENIKMWKDDVVLKALSRDAVNTF